MQTVDVSSGRLHTIAPILAHGFYKYAYTHACPRDPRSTSVFPSSHPSNEGYIQSLHTTILARLARRTMDELRVASFTYP